jgi:hypothetical protein
LVQLERSGKYWIQKLITFHITLTHLPVNFEDTMQNNSSDMGLRQAECAEIQARVNATTTFAKPL